MYSLYDNLGQRKLLTKECLFTIIFTSKPRTDSASTITMLFSILSATVNFQADRKYSFISISRATQGIPIGQQNYHVIRPIKWLVPHIPLKIVIGSRMVVRCNIGQWEMKSFPEIYEKVYLISSQGVKSTVYRICWENL